MRARMPLRFARAVVFSAVCVALSAFGHMLANGGAPALWTVVTGWVAVMAVATAAAGRERSPRTIRLTLIGAQFALHRLFDLGAPPVPASHHVAHSLTADAGMLLAHLTAALITAWWLARGEDLLWSVLRRLGSAVARLLPRPAAPVPPPVGGHATALPFPPAAPRRGVYLRHALVRRGPPLPA